MNKKDVQVGDKVIYKNTIAEVIERGDEYVIILFEGFEYGVDYSQISSLVINEQPVPTPTPPAPQPNIMNVKERTVANPTINYIYNRQTDSAFIVINKKITICIPNIQRKSSYNIAMSVKRDDDIYSEDIGNALAFYRSQTK